MIGIGGIGMSGIAELLINLGYYVSGSDLKETAVTRRLVKLGATVFERHHRDNIKGANVVVYSSAVSVDNPETVAARDNYIPVIPRGEMLAELMRLKYGVAIAGSHGKTTTTSMVAAVLTHAHFDPTVVIGGRLDMWGGANTKLGTGDILVAEADESDGSFLSLLPTIAVVTNIDQEHMDHYRDMDALRQAFVDFVNKIPFYGTAVICMDNEEIQGIIPRLKKRCLTYGTSSQADLCAKNIKKEGFGVGFDVFWNDQAMDRIVLGIPGEHNVLNALAATAVGLELNIGMDVIKTGLKNLGGLERRFQIKGEINGIIVLDDYGHHPTEIMATLKAAKDCWSKRRLIVVFQPHRYTRTRTLFDRFVTSFNEADTLIIAPVYAASEKPIKGVSSKRLVQGVREHGHKDVIYCRDEDETLTVVLATIKPGDVVITLGAGSICEIADRLLFELKKKR